MTAVQHSEILNEMDNQNQPTQEQPVTADQPTTESIPTPAGAPTPTTPPTQPATLPGRNWKKWIIIGGIVLVTLLTGTAYVLSQQKTQKPDNKTVVQPTAAQPSPASDPNADWKTYENAEHKYSFQHPGTWTITESGAGGANNISVGFISQSKLDVSGVTYCGENIRDGHRCDRITINETTNAEIDWGTNNSNTTVRIPHPAGGIITFTLNSLRTEEERKILRAILFSFKYGVTSKSTDPKTLCEQNEGTWLAAYNECESATGGIDDKTCKELGGTFSECDSACRHNSNPNAACIEVCINVCKF